MEDSHANFSKSFLNGRGEPFLCDAIKSWVRPSLVTASDTGGELPGSGLRKVGVSKGPARNGNLQRLQQAIPCRDIFFSFHTIHYRDEKTVCPRAENVR